MAATKNVVTYEMAAAPVKSSYDKRAWKFFLIAGGKILSATHD